MNPNQAAETAFDHHQAGRLPEAEKFYREALAADPSHAGALRNLGLLAHQLGKNEEAAALLGRSLQIDPVNAAAHNNFANALHALGRTEEAVPHYRRTLELRPDAAATHNNLGKALTELGRFEEAEQCFHRALAITPDYPEASNDLGTLYRRRGRLEEAAKRFQRALELNARFPEAHSNLADVLKALGRRDEAEHHYRAAIELQPASAAASVSLGTLLHEQGFDDAARETFRHAVELNPEDVPARWSLAMSQLKAIPGSSTDAEQGRAAFARELSKLAEWLDAGHSDSGHSGVGAQRPFYLAYHDANNRDLLSQYGQLCARMMEPWQRAQGLTMRSPAKGSAIKVGIVSAHIRDHSVWNAIVKGWVRHLDRTKFSVHLFAIDPARDLETEIAESLAASVDPGSRSVARWAALLADARLDVILYPEIGMDPQTIQLASMRLAPVQAASWGHPETTGLPTIDYFISAGNLEPPGAGEHYTERLITLPGLGCCVQRPGEQAAAVDFPAMGIDVAGPLLICPGTPWKYAPEHDHVLVEIARALGRCRFVFFRDRPDGLWRRLHERLQRTFAQAGLDFADYGVFIPWQPRAMFHALLRRADMFLDTIGFSGFNTAMQAVDCGIPIVAWDGRFLRGRLASGILKSLGLQALVAATGQEYVALAVKIAADENYRRQIRDQMEACRDVLYEDTAPVRAMEGFLSSVARQ